MARSLDPKEVYPTLLWNLEDMGFRATARAVRAEAKLGEDKPFLSEAAALMNYQTERILSVANEVKEKRDKMEAMASMIRELRKNREAQAKAAIAAEEDSAAARGAQEKRATQLRAEVARLEAGEAPLRQELEKKLKEAAKLRSDVEAKREVVAGLQKHLQERQEYLATLSKEPGKSGAAGGAKKTVTVKALGDEGQKAKSKEDLLPGKSGMRTTPLPGVMTRKLDRQVSKGLSGETRSAIRHAMQSDPGSDTPVVGSPFVNATVERLLSEWGTSKALEDVTRQCFRDADKGKAKALKREELQVFVRNFFQKYGVPTPKWSEDVWRDLFKRQGVDPRKPTTYEGAMKFTKYLVDVIAVESTSQVFWGFLED